MSYMFSRLAFMSSLFPFPVNGQSPTILPSTLSYHNSYPLSDSPTQQNKLFNSSLTYTKNIGAYFHSHFLQVSSVSPILEVSTTIDVYQNYNGSKTKY